MKDFLDWLITPFSILTTSSGFLLRRYYQLTLFLTNVQILIPLSVGIGLFAFILRVTKLNLIVWTLSTPLPDAIVLGSITLRHLQDRDESDLRLRNTFTASEVTLMLALLSMAWFVLISGVEGRSVEIPLIGILSSSSTIQAALLDLAVLLFFWLRMQKEVKELRRHYEFKIYRRSRRYPLRPVKFRRVRLFQSGQRRNLGLAS